MKALSIKQPHAQRIVSKEKKYEIRKWRTKYRGWVVICSSAKHDPRFPEAKKYPMGVSICLARLDDVTDFTPELSNDACCQWREGLFAWKLTDITPIDLIPVKGQLGLFGVPEVVRNHIASRWTHILE